jgi:hypothetical protein
MKEGWRARERESNPSKNLYSIQNEKDKAFEILEKLYKEKSPSLSALGSGPNWDNLRDDPRYKDLIKRIGLPEQK